MKRKTLLLLLVCSFVVISADIAYHKMRRDATAFRPENSDNLLAVSQVWKAASDLYGHFALLPEEFDWDREYEDAFHRAGKAEDGYEYYRTLSRFVAALQDGHQVVAPPDGQIFGGLPLDFWYVEGGYYLRATADRKAPLYSKLEKINGREAHAYLEEEIGPAVGLQTPLARQQQMISSFTGYGKKDEQVSLEFLTPDGERMTQSYIFGPNHGLKLGLSQKYQVAEVFSGRRTALHSSGIFTLYKADQDKPLSETILVLEVKTMAADGREELMGQILPYISQSQGCVIDLRSCDGGNTLNGLSILYPFVEDGVIASATGTEDALARVLEASLQSDREAEAEGEKNLSQWADLPKVEVPAVVLVHHTAGSAVDDTAAFAKAWGLPLVGTHTRGATGNVVLLSLANGWQVGFSGQRSLAPDGSDIWNRGIAADIQADYSLADLKAGVDTPLQAAIIHLQNEGAGAQGPQ